MSIRLAVTGSNLTGRAMDEVVAGAMPPPPTADSSNAPLEELLRKALVDKGSQSSKKMKEIIEGWFTYSSKGGSFDFI